MLIGHHDDNLTRCTHGNLTRKFWTNDSIPYGPITWCHVAHQSRWSGLGMCIDPPFHFGKNVTWVEYYGLVGILIHTVYNKVGLVGIFNKPYIYQRFILFLKFIYFYNEPPYREPQYLTPGIPHTNILIQLHQLVMPKNSLVNLPTYYYINSSFHPCCERVERKWRRNHDISKTCAHDENEATGELCRHKFQGEGIIVEYSIEYWEYSYVESVINLKCSLRGQNWQCHNEVKFILILTIIS